MQFYLFGKPSDQEHPGAVAEELKKPLILSVQVKVPEKRIQSCGAAVISHALMLCGCHGAGIPAAFEDGCLRLRKLGQQRTHHIRLRPGIDQLDRPAVKFVCHM